MDRTPELIQLLKSLKNAKFTPHSEYLKTVFQVDEVLDCFFQIEVSKTKFGPSEQNVIGPLIVEALRAIGTWVSHSVDEIHEGIIENYKIERSGLEFLLDRYREFPDGRGSRLVYAFEDFKATEDVEGWDEQFKNVNNSYDPNLYYKTSDEPTLNAQELKQVPESHWWWW